VFVLDTNVVSELRLIARGDGNDNVKRWVDGVEDSVTYVAAVTVLELEYGVLLHERTDPRQGQALRAWLEEALDGFDGRVLAFDGDTAKRAAGLHIPNPRQDRDAMIAATALMHGFSVVTRNVKDFQIDGLALIDPWS